jgi:hypothetical protein
LLPTEHEKGRLRAALFVAAKTAKSLDFSGTFALDTYRCRRYIPHTLRQAVSFACSERPPGNSLINLTIAGATCLEE